MNKISAVDRAIRRTACVFAVVLLVALVPAPAQANIFGPDDRNVVTSANRQAFASNSIAQINYRRHDMNWKCTGYIYGEKGGRIYIATAGHCIFSPSNYRGVYFGRGSTSPTLPYPRCDVVRSFRHPMFSSSQTNFDVGALELDCGLANPPGPPQAQNIFEIQNGNLSSFREGINRGYVRFASQSPPGGLINDQVGMMGLISPVGTGSGNSSATLVRHYADTVEGHSGGPLFRYSTNLGGLFNSCTGRPACSVGIHVRGGLDSNEAIRFHPPVRSWLKGLL